MAETRAQQLPQVVSPENLRPSEGSMLILEIHINFSMYRKILEKKITELLSPKKWGNLEKIRTAGVPDSKLSETSCIQSQMHFHDSVESIADSDLEDGELHKMLTSPLYAQKASAKPDALFSPEQGNLIRSSVFRNANPSNMRGSLLEGKKDHSLNQTRSDLAKQELHVESLNE